MTLAPKHVETSIVHGQRLGLRPRDHSRETLKLSEYLTGQLPDHPASVDYLSHVRKWRLGQNNRYSTCGPTAMANLALLVTTWLGDVPFEATDEQIFDLYRRSGNPQFDPATGAGDNGVEMSVMLSAALAGGIGPVTPLAFAEVNGNDPAEVWAAGALFGGTLWGADLTVAQQGQTDRSGVWDYVPGSSEWGGHAVMAAGRYNDLPETTSDRTGLVSWAQVLDSTDRFIQQQVQQRFVVIFPQHLGSRSFLKGVNVTALAADYTALTGRPFPLPAPEPGTGPSAADRTYADLIRGWARGSKRWGANGDAQRATLDWLTATGL